MLLAPTLSLTRRAWVLRCVPQLVLKKVIAGWGLSMRLNATVQGMHQPMELWRSLMLIAQWDVPVMLASGVVLGIDWQYIDSSVLDWGQHCWVRWPDMSSTYYPQYESSPKNTNAYAFISFRSVSKWLFRLFWTHSSVLYLSLNANRLRPINTNIPSCFFLRIHPDFLQFLLVISPSSP